MKQPSKQRATRSAKVKVGHPADIVVNQRFNGVTHFCNLTGYKPSTVHGWLCSGYIPPHQRGVSVHAHIMEIAQANRIKLPASDFVEQPGQALAANG